MNPRDIQNQLLVLMYQCWYWWFGKPLLSFDILFGLEKAGNSVILSHKRVDLWACSGHNLKVGQGKMTCPGWGGIHSCLINCLAFITALIFPTGH